MMNLAYVHLVLNHIPIIGIPVALVFLIFGLRTNNRGMERLALLVLAALAIVVAPIFLTGESAEEIMENQPGISESVMESHEDVAKVSLVLTLLTGALAAATWVLGARVSRNWAWGVVLFAVVAVASLGYTANLGGKIRHTELQP